MGLHEREIELEGLIEQLRAKLAAAEKDRERWVMRPPVSHYCVGEIESIDFIEDQGHMVGFCLGNIIKYATRCMHKGEALRDLEKIASYSIMLREYLEEKDGE